MEFQHDKFNYGLHAINNAVGHHFISEEELDIIDDEIVNYYKKFLPKHETSNLKDLQ